MEDLDGVGTSGSHSSTAIPSMSGSTAKGSNSLTTPTLPQAGRPHSLEPPDSSSFTGASSSSAAPPPKATPESCRDRDEVLAEVEPIRPKENPKLTENDLQLLREDSFLLGKDVSNGKQPEKSEGHAVDETFAQLDVALKRREYNVAEVLWLRMVRIGAARLIPDRPELRAIASRYVSAMCPRIQDELEDAIERKDVSAAERERQRLVDLRKTCNDTRMDIVEMDRQGRSAELEARYQQLCSKNGGPLVCNLFPRVTGCQHGQETCVLL